MTVRFTTYYKERFRREYKANELAHVTAPEASRLIALGVAALANRPDNVERAIFAGQEKDRERA
jgi:hypothetical protein